MTIRRFHWADYVVTVAVLILSLGIGFFFALFKGGQKTKMEYLLGNREMSLGPVALSLFVTFQSAVSLIGTPSDAYNTGPMVMYISVGVAIAYCLGLFTVVPLTYPLHITSVYEYLELRFQSSAVRLLGTCIGMIQTTLYMGVALLSPALALQTAAGLPLWMSIAIVGCIGTAYTAVGGIKSVIWTDAFQTIIVFTGIITVLVKGLISVGGFNSMIKICLEGGRMDFAELNPDLRERHSMWGCIIGGCVMWLVNCFNQSSVQRIGSLKTLKSAKIAFFMNCPLNIIYGALLTFTGLLLYSYVITVGCDPYQAGLIKNRNQMMPYFVIHLLDDLPGFSGLYMSMLFSGALSTLSSGINALAANSVEDILAKPLKNLQDTTVTVIAKVLVAVYGLLTIGLAYLMKTIQGPVTEGAIGGTLAGLCINLWVAAVGFLYGSPTRYLPPGPTDNCHINTTTATPVMEMVDLESSVNSSLRMTSPGYSVTTSSIVLNSTSTSMDKPFSINDISYLWIGTLGLVVSYSVGVIISLITGCNDPERPDSRFIFPFCRKIYGLPEPVHRPEDTSNVIAMKNYRKAWDVYKNRSTEQEIFAKEAGVNGEEKLLEYDDSKNSRYITFVPRNGSEAD